MTTTLPVVSADSGEEYPPLSALNDLLFCQRRCYLHRVEGVWLENAHTVTGSREHRRVHAEGETTEGDRRDLRGLWLVSHRLRLAGVADLVEASPDPATGKKNYFPVEYKRGRRRRWDNDDVQLCAQAMCLEEMLGVGVPKGAVFHARSRRRREVTFDAALRRRTEEAAAALHRLLAARSAPARCGTRAASNVR